MIKNFSSNTRGNKQVRVHSEETLKLSEITNENQVRSQLPLEANRYHLAHSQVLSRHDAKERLLDSKHYQPLDNHPQWASSLGQFVLSSRSRNLADNW